MKNTCVVIPTLNEAGGIEEILTNIRLNTQTKWVVIVDDGSTDGTIDIIKNKQTSDPDLILIERPKPKSFAKSYIDGFHKALELGADYIIQMDADGSHDPLVINSMIKGLENNDFVIGSRYVKGGGVSNWSKTRLAISSLGNLYSRTMLWLPIRDITGGFNGWKKETLCSIDLPTVNCTGYIFQLWLKYRALRNGGKYIEIPIIFAERKSGQSKFHSGIIMESIIDVLKIRFTDHLK